MFKGSQIPLDNYSENRDKKIVYILTFHKQKLPKLEREKSRMNPKRDYTMSYGPKKTTEQGYVCGWI